MATRTRNVTTCNPVYNKTLGRYITTDEIRKLTYDAIQYMNTLGLSPYKCEQISFNTAFRKACGMTRRKDNLYRIEFSVAFFQVADELHIKEVILHECIHLVPGCWDHQAKFKQIAQLLNKKYGTNIERTIADPQYMAIRKEQRENNHKYQMKCPVCGKIWKRQRGGRWVHNFKFGLTRYSCPLDKAKVILEERINNEFVKIATSK